MISTVAIASIVVLAAAPTAIAASAMLALDRTPAVAARFFDPDYAAELLQMHEPRRVVESLSGLNALSADERLLLGGAYFELGRYREAWESLGPAVEAYASARTFICIDLIRAESRRLWEGPEPSRETEAFYERFRPRPGHELEAACFHFGKGWVLLARKRHEEGRLEFQKAQRSLDLLSGRFPFMRGWRSHIDEAVGWSQLLQGDHARAMKTLRPLTRAAATDPFSFPVWAHLGAAYAASLSSDKAAAGRELEAVRKFFPREADGYFPALNAHVRAIEGAQGQDAPAAPFRAFPEQSLLHWHPFSFFIGTPDFSKAAHMLRGDFDALAGLSREYGFRLMILGYPAKPRRAINSVLSQLAAKYGLGFADLLGEIGDISDKKNLFLSRDGTHPNEEGYRRMAEAVYKRLPSTSAGIRDRR